MTIHPNIPLCIKGMKWVVEKGLRLSCTKNQEFSQERKHSDALAGKVRRLKIVTSLNKELQTLTRQMRIGTTIDERRQPYKTRARRKGEEMFWKALVPWAMWHIRYNRSSKPEGKDRRKSLPV